MDPISNFKKETEKVILFLKQDLKSIRTGRANPALVENVIVDAYSGQSKLKLFELATITSEGPSTLVIIPFDPATLSEIEKAILKSPLNLSPQTQTNRISLRLPALSTDQRQKLTKLLSQTIEDKKTIIRNLRDSTRKKIRLAFEAKEITEDGKFRQEKEIDNNTQKYMEEIQKIKENKTNEIMSI